MLSVIAEANIGVCNAAKDCCEAVFGRVVGQGMLDKRETDPELKLKQNVEGTNDYSREEAITTICELLYLSHAFSLREQAGGYVFRKHADIPCICFTCLFQRHATPH